MISRSRFFVPPISSRVDAPRFLAGVLSGEVFVLFVRPAFPRSSTFF